MGLSNPAGAFALNRTPGLSLGAAISTGNNSSTPQFAAPGTGIGSALASGFATGNGLSSYTPSQYGTSTVGSPAIPAAVPGSVVSVPPNALGASPGSAATAATQQASDLAKYFPELAGVSGGIVNNLAPVKYSIGTNPTISSGSFAPATTADALSARSDAANGMMNGTSNGVPSTSFLQSLFGNAQSAAGDVTTSAAAMNQQRLAQLNAVESAYTQGGMTTGGRDAAINDINQRFGNTFSTLEVGNQAANANFDAYSKFYSTFMQPQNVAPGSTLVTPLGQPIYQGSGASPQTIAQQASTFIAQDEATGNLQLSPDGTINQQYYQNKANSYYQNGLVQGQQAGTAPSQPATGATGVAALPPNIANQPYVIPASGTAPAYINLGRVPTGQQQYVSTTAGAAGIPVLSADDASNVQGIQYTQQALQPLEQVMNQVLQPGVLGRGINIAKNAINSIFQNQPDLIAFNSARSTAIKVIQSLAAGSGSGFRLTQPEIDTATDNMPLATDNLETAQTKLQYVKSFLANELNLKITGNANNYASPASQSTGAATSNPFSASNFYGS